MISLAFLETLPFVLSVLYIFIAPFHKVEESFHLQATHDVLIHGTDLASYDHNMFPGPVPRTFLGALLLSLFSWPWRALLGAGGVPKLFLQLAVRITLAGGVCSSLGLLLRAASARLGSATAATLALTLCAAPHYLFYASRTLPNTFAMLLMARAAAHWLSLPRVNPASPLREPSAWAWHAATALPPPSPHLWATIAYTAAAVLWFRCDLLALLPGAGLAWLLGGRATLPQLLALGAATGAVAIAATMAVDTPLWGACKASWLCAPGGWLWPELNVLLINTGTDEQDKYTDQHHALHWYFSSALPKSMGAAVLLVPVGLLASPGSTLVGWVRGWLGQTQQQQSSKPGKPGKPGSALSAAAALLDWQVCELALPALAYPALLSLLKNKQLRFILPVYPMLFLAAGSGMVKLGRLAEQLLALRSWGAAAAAEAAGAAETSAEHSSAAAVEDKKPSTVHKRRASVGSSKSTAPASSRNSSSSSSSRSSSSSTASTALPSPLATSSLSLAGYAIYCALGASLLLSATATAAFLYTAHYNYPGGRALQRLYTLLDSDQARSASAGKAGSALLMRSLPSPGSAGAAAVLTSTLPPCLAGDVVGASWGVEWLRQCVAGDCAGEGSAAAAAAASSGVAGGRACAERSALAPIRVHISNLAAQTGVSRFGEAWSSGSSGSGSGSSGRRWEISKEEHLGARELGARGFDFLIAESPSAGGEAYSVVGGGVVEGLVPGVDGWHWSWRQPLALRFTTSPVLYILRRNRR